MCLLCCLTGDSEEEGMKERAAFHQNIVMVGMVIKLSIFQVGKLRQDDLRSVWKKGGSCCASPLPPLPRSLLVTFSSSPLGFGMLCCGTVSESTKGCARIRIEETLKEGS